MAEAGVCSRPLRSSILFHEFILHSLLYSTGFQEVLRNDDGGNNRPMRNARSFWPFCIASLIASLETSLRLCSSADPRREGVAEAAQPPCLRGPHSLLPGLLIKELQNQCLLEKGPFPHSFDYQQHAEALLGVTKSSIFKYLVYLSKFLLQLQILSGHFPIKDAGNERFFSPLEFCRSKRWN